MKLAAETVFVVVCFAACSAIRAQESAQLFAAPEVIATDLDSFRVALDLNADGDKDAISVWFNGASQVRLAGWWNDGAGVLTQGWAVSYPLTYAPPVNPGTNIPARFGVGDLDGDGAEDFVFSVHNLVGWWISHGDVIAPGVPWAVQLPAPVIDLVVRDFTGDGLSDVAVMTAQGATIYQTRVGLPPLLLSSSSTPGDGTALVAAFVDSGASPDLAILRPFAIELHPVLGGVIQTGIGFPFFGGGTSTLVSGDVDQDGDVDLVISTSFPGSPTSAARLEVAVVRNTGPMGFNLEVAQSFPPGVRPSVLADADSDGDLDLIGVGGNRGVSALAPPFGNLIAETAELRRNSGTGIFGAAAGWLVFGATGDLAPADLDGDGDIDLLGGRCVSFGVPGSGLFPTTLSIDPSGIAPIVDFDRDGDGDIPGIPGLDLGGAPVLAPFVNDGTGTFGLATAVVPPAAPGTSYSGPGFAGDFDGDGDVDLLVEHLNGPTPASAFEMRLLKNVGGGGLVDGGPATATGQTMRTVPTATGPVSMNALDWRSVLVVDVDGDGDRDLVTVYPAFGAGYVQNVGSKIWLNDGTGLFAPGQDFVASRMSACGELTGDGIPDLVGIDVGTHGIAALVMRPGLGAGAFGAPVTLHAAMSALHALDRAVIVDFDQDGDLDLVAAVPGFVDLFTNDGFGNFNIGPIGSLDSNDGSDTVMVADVNSDGLLDVLANPGPSTSTTRVWLKDPAGPGYLPPRTYSANPGSLFDADGDGDLDLFSGGAVTGLSAVPVRTLSRNKTFSPAGNGLRKQYRLGLAGSGGFIPVLGCAGVLRPGHSGELRVSNALGGALAALGIGSAEQHSPLFGGSLLIVPDSVVPLQLGGAAGVAGAGYGTFGWTLPPGFAGFHAFQQVAVIDPGAPQGWSLTQGLEILVGF